MPDTRLKRLPAAFYRTAAGGEPVRDWLRSLGPEDRKAIGDDIRLVEFGWPVGMPTCRPIGSGLFEVRSDLGGNRIARVFFSVERGYAVLLHGFLKKSRKTPPQALETARRRAADLRERMRHGQGKD
jgi:phage-related protein